MQNKEEKSDRDFLINIMFRIRDYAIEHDMEPDDTIKTVAENMLAILKIATFNGGGENEDND